MHEVDDDGLVLAWRDGHEEAAEVLVRRHGPALLRHLRRMAGADAAEDLLQETFATFFGAVDRYRAKGLLKAYLFRIATSRARDRARRLDRERTPSPLLVEGGDPLDPAASLEKRERIDGLRRALGELPETQREAVVLATWEGLDYASIARIAGCTLDAVRQRIFRAREHLRQRLFEARREEGARP